MPEPTTQDRSLHCAAHACTWPATPHNHEPERPIDLHDHPNVMPGHQVMTTFTPPPPDVARRLRTLVAAFAAALDELRALAAFADPGRVAQPPVEPSETPGVASGTNGAVSAVTARPADADGASLPEHRSITADYRCARRNLPHPGHRFASPFGLIDCPGNPTAQGAQDAR